MTESKSDFLEIPFAKEISQMTFKFTFRQILWPREESGPTVCQHITRIISVLLGNIVPL